MSFGILVLVLDYSRHGCRISSSRKFREERLSSVSVLARVRCCNFLLPFLLAVWLIAGCVDRGLLFLLYCCPSSRAWEPLSSLFVRGCVIHWLLVRWRASLAVLMLLVACAAGVALAKLASIATAAGAPLSLHSKCM
mgnify:CR=1 FL=1